MVRILRQLLEATRASTRHQGRPLPRTLATTEEKFGLWPRLSSVSPLGAHMRNEFPLTFQANLPHARLEVKSVDSMAPSTLACWGYPNRCTAEEAAEFPPPRE